MRRLVVFALLLTACAGNNDRERIEKSARSWHAMVAVTSDFFRAGDVSATYAKQVAEVAEDALKNRTDKESQSALDAARTLRAKCEKR